ncbi:MAG TPA: tetratricopeptide repeat protein [Enhygromyxa sp.]|nr:tetratricopeptide repeat protein [Enhygromyxa sp.]
MLGSDLETLEGTGHEPTTDSELDARHDLEEPEEPGRIGRHVVIERLGAGGMGVVYAAYDPELDRKLAIKLIRASGRDNRRAQARMIREAQAMAKVTHPNVIAIYDVGTFAGQVYIAMEFVAGRSLDRWVASLEQPLRERWRSILSVHAEAGRGLAAAHEAGLVHRDFKPANVLVGDDGRVRVCDFGLARASRPREHGSAALVELDVDVDLHDTATLDGSGPRSGSLDDELTEVGALIGTPAYMPPERLAGEHTDARGDQFSFCVTLWESLYGRRPYAGATLPELFDSLLAGRRSEPEAERRAAVPDWLHEALLRGCARDPEQRFPDMRALLAALEPPVAPQRRGAALAFAIAGVALVVASAWSFARSSEPSLCSGYAARLDGIWDDDRKATLAHSFAGSQLRYAERSADQVIAAIDAWTGDWVAQRTDACEATHARGEQSAELLDLRMACFDRRLAELDALIGVLEAGGETVVEHAVASVASLDGLAGCADAERLRNAPREPEDEQLRARTSELDGALTKLAALTTAGRYLDAVREAEAIADEVAATQWLPLIGRHALLLGQAHAEHDATEPALAALIEALAIGRELDVLQLSAPALVDILWTLRHDATRVGELERWIRVAEAEVRRLGDPLLEARMRIHIGRARWNQGRYDEASGEFERALALRTAELGPDSLAVAEARDAIADTLWRSGKIAEARALYLEIAQSYQAALGPDHPQLAILWNDIGATTWLTGDYEGALQHYRDALALLERIYGPDDWRLGQIVGNIGACYAMQGRYDEARPYFQRSVELERARNDSSGELAINLENLAELELLDGDRNRARELFDEAHALRVRLLGDQHPDTARSLIKLGRLELEAGQAAAAREHYERAIALREGLAVHRDLLGEARMGLAEALALLGERERLPELIAAAQADYEASGTQHAERDAAIEATAARLLGEP